MKHYLAAAAVLLASAGAASSQTIVPCDDTSATADLTGECSAAPTLMPAPTTPDIITGITLGVDQNATSAIPQPTPPEGAIPQLMPPEGMSPLVVPNDPLGQGISQNPVGTSIGSQGSIRGNSVIITSPAIR